MTNAIPSAATNGSARTWNLVFAASFLGLSAWTLIADLRHEAHFLLQTSLSSLFLGLFISGWMVVATLYAALPKRFILGAAAISTSRLAFGWPLLERMDLRSACLVLDLLLAVLAGIYLVTALRDATLAGRPNFHWRHCLAMSVAGVLALIVSLPVNYLGLVHLIHDLSAGYVRLSPQGVDLQERIFMKDGRHVHLVGMAHIGDRSFYETLNRNIASPAEGRRLVLVEGVSDAQSLLPESFASGEIYGSFAAKLGLIDQAVGFDARPNPRNEADSIDDWTEAGVDFRRADIDIQELSPEHRSRLVALLSSLEQVNLADMFKLPDDMTAMEFQDLIVQGLLKQRNDRLMEIFAESAGDYTEIFIPWGAAHLPDLERRVIALGYKPVKETSRRIIDFASLLRRS